MKCLQVLKTENGWSEKVFPISDGYLMQCCDCGLTHKMKFRAIEITKQKDGEFFEYKVLPKNKYRVMLQAKRAKR